MLSTCSLIFMFAALTGNSGKAHPEDYEIKNGSEPVWVNIYEAIAHNQKVMDDKEDSMGLSIDRETRVLKLIVDELLDATDE